MMKHMVFVTTVGILIGCNQLPDPEQLQWIPRPAVQPDQYNSIYHFGYNQGCESALAKVGEPWTRYAKDESLDGTETAFNQGWEKGYASCQSQRNEIYQINAKERLK